MDVIRAPETTQKRILQTTVPGIPIVLRLRTRILDPCAYAVFGAPFQADMVSSVKPSASLGASTFARSELQPRKGARGGVQHTGPLLSSVCCLPS